MPQILRPFYVLPVIALLALCGNIVADEINIATDGITDFFGNGDGIVDDNDAGGLLFDEARTGGGDTAAQGSFNPSRFLEPNAGSNDNWADGLVPGTGGMITITGLGLPFRGGTTATIVTVTVTYLGADGMVNTNDDEIVGIATDDLNYSVVGEYAWQFTTPMEFDWDGLNNRFRFAITGIDGNVRFKSRPVNESPSGQGGIPMSVGGSMDSDMVLLGDVNLDGVVDLLDVQPFVSLVTTGGFQVEADINMDGFVDLLDVQPFVQILTGG